MFYRLSILYVASFQKICIIPIYYISAVSIYGTLIFHQQFYTFLLFFVPHLMQTKPILQSPAVLLLHPDVEKINSINTRNTERDHALFLRQRALFALSVLFRRPAELN